MVADALVAVVQQLGLVGEHVTSGVVCPPVCTRIGVGALRPAAEHVVGVARNIFYL